MKKRNKIVIVASVLMALFVAFSATAAGVFQYGDANGDGKIDVQDLTHLWGGLAKGDVSAELEDGCPDVNGDGIVNMKDVALLQRYLDGGWGVELPDSYAPLSGDLSDYEVLSTVLSENGVICTSFRYGQSVLNRDLVCWSIQQDTYSRTILLNFAIHGWEDSYAADGQLLVDLGNALVEHYSKSDDLKDCRLLIIPCANPDGIAEGTTNNGFGRCNADGIDLNRDFDVDHVAITTDRNYTPAPFSGVESRAMRDLVLATKPSIVIDFHGWLNYTIGNSELAEVFSTCVGLNHSYEFSSGANGYFAHWAEEQGAEALLVEFKDTNSIVNNDVISAVDKLMANNYGAKQSDYPLDSDFAEYDNIVTYAIASEKVYTQKQVDGTDTTYGYINPATDECTILQIYDNGWCKVNYPVDGLTKTGYCEVSAFIDPQSRVEHFSATVSANTEVCTAPDMSVHLGSVWSTDTFTVIAKRDNLAQIIYPLDDGGYKMGWINTANLQVIN